LLVNDEWIESGHGTWVAPADFQLRYEVRVMGASLARVYHREPPP